MKKIICALIGIILLVSSFTLFIQNQNLKKEINALNARIIDLEKRMEETKKSSPTVVQPTASPTILMPTLTFNIDISDWKIYKNEEFGFEIKYPREKWEECGFTGGKLFFLVRAGERCYLTADDKPIEAFSNSIIISSELDIYSKYNNYEVLKDAFLKTPNSDVAFITMFNVMGRDKVDNVKESMIGQVKSLTVQVLHESYGVISTERYIFHNQNLFNISSVNSPIVVPNTNNKIYDASVVDKDIEQIISTFKFTKQ